MAKQGKVKAVKRRNDMPELITAGAGFIVELDKGMLVPPNNGQVEVPTKGLLSKGAEVAIQADIEATLKKMFNNHAYINGSFTTGGTVSYASCTVKLATKMGKKGEVVVINDKAECKLQTVPAQDVTKNPPVADPNPPTTATVTFNNVQTLFHSV